MSSRKPKSLSLRSAVIGVVEQLERRFMLAAEFSALINFQPSGSPTYSGYLVDSGATFGDRGNGFSYGWDSNISADTRDRNMSASPDQRYDTLNHVQKAGNRTWELAVPFGQYIVRMVSGDPGYINSVYKFNVEGQLAVNATPSSARMWVESSAYVSVSDGRLTVTNALGSDNNKINFIEVYSATGFERPSMNNIIPANGSTAVSRGAFIGVDVNLPGGALDPTTVNTSTVKMFRVSDNLPVPASVNTSGGGDSIVLQPTSVLEANTAYYFEISSGVRDVSGNAFVPYSMTFTTGTAGGPVTSDIEFTKSVQSSTTGSNYTAIVVGPDHNIYAGTVDGRIIRYPINTDGSLGTGQTISTVQTNNGGPRLLSGIVFDPASTANNLVLWVTHGDIDFDNPPHWSGKLSLLTGANLQNYQDKVIGLPRAAHNHLTNQPVFGPDGFLYVSQGGNTAQGAKDSTWGLRDESLLSAAILRIDTAALPSGSPLNVQTEGLGSNNYNPWAANAPVKLYATGLRNAYDLTWTSNGHLFAPNNGSNPGGATPGTPSLPIPGSIRIDGDDDGDPSNGHYSSPAVPGINPLNEGQDDYFYHVVQNGYYGHPNPSRYEYVLNGGNPTSDSDPEQVSSYPVGTLPDRNYRGAAFNFGAKLSPNGIIEYQGSAFGGALAGKLLVVRYSGGDDIIILTPDANGNIVASQTGLAGMTGFNDPLDLIEDPVTGNIYVAEFGGMRITLLKPIGGSATVPSTPENVVASVVSSTRIRVTWDDVPDAASYRIQRMAPGESTFSDYAVSTSTVFEDIAVQALSTYSYRVRAENAAVGSAYSSESTITTPAAGQWSTGIALPFPMAELGGAIINGKMYVAGENNTSTWEFDFTTQQWTARADRPFTGNTSEAEHATETVGGLLYLIGGLTGGSENKVQIFNPATNSWSLGTERAYHAGSSLSAVINGEIYVTGGAVTVPSYQPVANTSKYNPVTNTWASLAAMPLPRHSAAGGTDGQKLYVFGGRDAGLEASDGTDTVQIYDPATNTWQTSEQPGSLIPRMPRPMRGASIKAVFYNGEFYVFGGENSSGSHGATSDNVFDRVDIYNPTTRTWRIGAPMPTARHATVAILHQDKVYVVGGGVVRGTSFSNIVEVLDLLANSAPTVPAAPSNLLATGVSSSAVSLTWTDNSTDETGFEIQRKTGSGGTYATIFTTGTNATSYLDADPALQPDTQYFYQVRALKSSGPSAFSNEDGGTTQPAGVVAYEQGSDPDHLVVFEVEQNDGVVNQGGKTWTANSTAGFSGTGALQATPNTGTNRNTGYVTQSPRIDFKVNFTQTGTHYVWVRGYAPTGSDDTVHVGLDGVGVSTGDRMNGFTPGAYLWSRTTMDGPVSTINVTTPGIHTVNVWMREDGFIVDKLVLTTNNAFVPTGTGPVPSPRSDGPAPQPPAAASDVDATANSHTSVGLTWTDNSNNETGFKVMRKTGAGGTYQTIHTTAAGVTSFIDNTAVASTTYFYKVVATNAVADAPDSNEDSVTTPAAPVPGALTPDQTQIEFNDPNDANPSGSQTLTITTNGADPITIPANGVTIVGTDAARFAITSNHGSPTVLNQGQSLVITVTYTSNAVTIHDATLRISNNSSVPQLDVGLRGLGTAGEFGETEPALQRILDLYRIPVNVGDDDTGTTAIPYPPIAGNDEVNTDLFQKAGPGNVTIEALGTFGSFFSTFLRFGHYVPGNTAAKTELFSVPGTDAQTVNPTLNGITSFDPGANPFGIYTVWPEFSDREVFSEDQFNTWETNASQRTKVRFWPLKNPDGTTVPNAYIFGFEEAGNHDLQDFAGIIRNVVIPVVGQPAFQQGASPDHLIVAEAENNDGVINQGGKTWSSNTTPGFSGTGARQATPNTGVNRNTGYVTQSPRIDFRMNFTQTGTHYVWIRGLAPTGSDDTVHVGFDGAAVTTSDRMNGFPDGVYTWSNSTMDGVVAQINVTTPGIHTLNVWMREDGFIVDKVLLTTNAAFVPAGTGPAQSPHSGHVAPTAPTGLNVTGTTGTSVSLAWNDNATTETGYKIFRKVGPGGTYELIFTTAADATSHTDTTALPNTNYFYKVVGTNSFGDSADSNEVQTTTPTVTAPAAPSGLDATAQSAASIGLTWNDNATNETEYRVERKIGAAGVWAAIQLLPADSTSYTDIDLDAATTYFYRVVAVNPAAEAMSNEDSATTLAAPTTFNSSNIDTPLVGSITTITEGNAYDITGGGLDIYNAADSFHFANQSRTGDFDVRVQIASFTAGDPKAKAGLMVRESLASGSVNLFAGVTIGDGYRFSRRASTGGTTTNLFKGGTVTFPTAWVRLRRQGNTFTGYRSADGQTWTQMGQVSQALPATVFFGLATSSKSNSATAAAQYRQLDELPVAPSGNAINWVDGVDAPLAVQETLTVQVGNQLFVMGGYMSGLTATRTSYKLNLDTNVWTQIADVPNAQTHVAVASDGTFIYAVGGQIGSGESDDITAEAWKYHIATNTWSPFTALPEARAGGATVYHNGFLHFFGGVLSDRVTVSNKHWAIPVNESTGWLAKADLINPGDHLSGHELNGKIYAIGGEHDHGFDYIQHDALSEYDPLANTWTSKAPLPVASSHFEGGTLVVHGRLVLLGGQIDGELQTDAVRSWNPATNTWTAHTALPLVRKGGSAAFWNDTVLYTAGRGTNVNGGPVYSKDTWVGTFQSPWWTSSSSSQSQPLSAAARRTFFNDSLIAADGDLGSDDEDLNIATRVAQAPIFAK